ncbi:DUF397 domain-containing protein [Streptomyces pimonensis]|uniref:DUF397 domain-containing protein n=1 Tax=Streptomyces pimonensis TaxID=2860288 RepID=A0ABV4IZP2_9ACTN
MPYLEFRRSSHSGGDAHGERVGVARDIPGTVAVRNSKDAAGAVLRLAPSAWAAFHAGAVVERRATWGR